MERGHQDGNSGAHTKNRTGVQWTRGSAPLSNALNAGAKLIGINNRDLNTMTTDLSTTEEIGLFLIENGIIVVSESGINTESDIRRLKGKCNAFLIGSSLMRSKRPQKLLEGFVSA